jgi:hypothetical protein
VSLAHNAGLCTVGVEEELPIVDPAEGRPLPLAGGLLACWRGPCRIPGPGMPSGRLRVSRTRGGLDALCSHVAMGSDPGEAGTPEWHGWADGKTQGEYQEAVPEPRREHKGPFGLSMSRRAGTAATAEMRRGEMVLGTK